MRNPTARGCFVSARADCSLASTSSAEGFGIVPSPPASDTAAASAGVPIGPPSDASCTGSRQPTKSVKRRLDAISRAYSGSVAAGHLSDRRVDPLARLDRLDVEPGRGELPVAYAEHDHARHLEAGSVPAPFGPQRVRVDGRGDELGPEVGHAREDGGPVRADLVAADERAIRVRGLLAVVVGSEEGYERVDVVRVHRVGERGGERLRRG